MSKEVSAAESAVGASFFFLLSEIRAVLGQAGITVTPF